MLFAVGFYSILGTFCYSSWTKKYYKAFFGIRRKFCLGPFWYSPKATVRMRVSAHCADAFLNVSFSPFIAQGCGDSYLQGCGDSYPCGDSGHCAVFELNHLEPALFTHPCAETPTCAILIETKTLLWGVSNAHPCAKTATCASKTKITANIALRVLYHVWYGLVGVQYWHAQMFRLTAYLGQMM